MLRLDNFLGRFKQERVEGGDGVWGGGGVGLQRIANKTKRPQCDGQSQREIDTSITDANRYNSYKRGRAPTKQNGPQNQLSPELIVCGLMNPAPLYLCYYETYFIELHPMAKMISKTIPNKKSRCTKYLVYTFCKNPCSAFIFVLL